MPEQLLSVRDLKVWFPVRMGIVNALRGAERKNVRAVDGIDFEINRGEVFCLVGESGCGKTTTGKAILRLNDASGGNILYSVPAVDMERLEAIEQRLEELAPAIEQLNNGAGRDARRAFAELQRLEGSVLGSLYPWRTVSSRLFRERLERSVAYLREREEELKAGRDPAVARMIAAERERLELLTTMGPDFTPRRAKRYHALQKELKEARYRLARAEVTATRVRRSRWKFRRLDRRTESLKAKIRGNGSASTEAVRNLQETLRAKQGHLTEIELAGVEADLAKQRKEIAALDAEESRAAQAAERALPGIAKRMSELRAKGGPVLEALELQALRDNIFGRYDLTHWSKERTAELRKRMQIIYQDPYESLNPKMSIFDIVSEPLLANKIVDTPAEAEAVIRTALEDVGLKPAEEYMFRYPHELSGGQRQRVGIATALVVDPDFIMADEPVSMLDASVRTEILALLLELKKRRSLTYLFITHDLGLAWIIADKIAVMYLGKIVEMGDGATVIRNPQHPYTRSLISVVPSPNPNIRREKIILKGERPDPIDIPAGCRFHPRCPNAVGICGWEAHEVLDELTTLLKEDAANFPEAKAAGQITADSPGVLSVATPSPDGCAAYLRQRIPAVAPGRPALGAIREISPTGTALRLTLHKPEEPPLRMTANGAQVACHLVEAAPS